MALINTDFPCAALGRMHSFCIFIPDFIKGPFEEAKVITLLHGLGGNRNDWILNSNVTEIAEKRGYVLIFPEAAQSFYINTASGERYYDSVKELIGYCRRLFRISDKREKNFIAGMSMGGYGAMRIGLKNCDKFSAIGSFSGSLDIVKSEKLYEDGTFAKVLHMRNIGTKEFEYYGTDRDLKQLLNNVPEELIPTLYLSCGKADDLFGMNNDMYEYIESKGINVHFTKGEGNHCSQEWNKGLAEFLEMIK